MAIEQALIFGEIWQFALLSEDKRAAILEAATELVALLGVKRRDREDAKGRMSVAEGTLFTYFAQQGRSCCLTGLYQELARRTFATPSWPATLQTKA